MKTLFINVVELSITTGALIILWLLVQRMWGGIIKASTRYIIWSVILLRLLFPVESRLSLIKYYKSVPVVDNNGSSASSSDIDILEILCGVWLTVAVLMFLFRAITYLVFVIKIHRNSFIINDVGCAVPVLVSDKVATPCLCGLLFQKIIIPKIPDNKKDLEMMLEHELCHRKRFDLFVKLIDNIIKCAYWFDPFVYILSSQLTLNMEMSCDEAVLKNKTREERIYYAEMMLRVMKGQTSSVYVPMTTGFSYGFWQVKKRFSDILSDGKKRNALIVVIIVTILGLLCGTLFGVSVVEMRPVDQNNNAVLNAVDAVSKNSVKVVTTENNGGSKATSAVLVSENIVTQEQNPQPEDNIHSETTSLSVAETEPKVTIDTSTVVDETLLPSVTSEPDTTVRESDNDTHYNDTDYNEDDSGLPKPGTPPGPSGAEYVEIFFDVNGGDALVSSDEDNAEKYAVGRPIGNLPIPRRSGYIFDGWWTVDSEGDFSILFTEDTIVTKQCVLVAKWREIKEVIQ